MSNFSITLPITVLLTILLWHAVPLVFSIAFYLWWRRVKHWSFALLSAATALGVVAQICSSLAINIPRHGKTLEQVAITQDIWALAQASLVLYLVMGLLLLVGAFGLVFAARDDFLLENPGKNIRTG